MSLRARLLLALGAVAITSLAVADVAIYSSLHASLFNQVEQSLTHDASQLLSVGPPGGQGFGPGGPFDQRRNVVPGVDRPGRPPHLERLRGPCGGRLAGGVVRVPGDRRGAQLPAQAAEELHGVHARPGRHRGHLPDRPLGREGRPRLRGAGPQVPERERAPRRRARSRTPRTPCTTCSRSSSA